MPGLDSPGNGHRIVEPFATCLPVTGHLGGAICRQLPGLGCPGLGDTELRFFLGLRPEASSPHVALRPARLSFETSTIE